MFREKKSRKVRETLARWLDDYRVAQESGASGMEETAVARALAAVAKDKHRTSWQIAMDCIADEAAESEFGAILQQEERVIERERRVREEARRREAENAAELELRRRIHAQLEKSLAAERAGDGGKGKPLGRILFEEAGANAGASAALTSEIERKEQLTRERKAQKKQQEKEAERQRCVSYARQNEYLYWRRSKLI